MKFGTFITKVQGEAMAADLRKAEELGFESAWIADHMVIPVRYESRYPYTADGRFPVPPDAPFHDPMLMLAYAAAVTSKIRLATGIFVLPMRNAFATAKAVATLDVLSNGRFTFGVGIGWFVEEFAVLGMKFEDRALRTREYLELMIELWTKSDPVYKGKTIAVEGIGFMPHPVQKPYPPIVFGGTSDSALKRAVRIGDGWYGIAHSLEQARTLIARLRELERERQRTKPVEVTLSLRTGAPLTLDDVRRLAELGVERTLAGLPLRALDAPQMERFRDEIMHRL